MRLPGLSFSETLSGNYWRLDAPTDERAITLHLDASTHDIGAAGKTWQLRGFVEADDLACRSAIEGTIDFQRFDEQRIPYRFSFRVDDGRTFEFLGEKHWRGLTPLASVTLLAASLYDDKGDEFARATLRFDVRADGIRWVKSLRLSF